MILFSILALAGIAAAAAPTPQPPAAGPIVITMTVDQAKQAAPGAVWTDIGSAASGKTVGASGNDVWTLEGQTYNVKLKSLSHGAKLLAIDGLNEVRGIGDCRARVLALAAHFNAYFERLDDQSVRFVCGFAKQELLSAGRSARVLERSDYYRAEWAAGQPVSAAYPYSIEINANLFSASASRCEITAKVRFIPPGRPVAEMLDTKRMKPVASPSADVIHRSLDGLEPLRESMTLDYTCDVSRETGALSRCELREAEEQNRILEVRAGRTRLAAMKFNPTSYDPDDDLPLRGEFTIKLSPSDRDPKLEAAAPASAVWLEFPSADTVNKHYPQRALERDVEARVVATCLIKADSSLEVLELEITPPSASKLGFDEAVRRLLKHHRAAPRLRNGQPAVGATVKVPVRFQFAD